MENKTKQVRRRKNDERKTTNYYRKTHSQLYTHKPKNNSRKKWQPKKFIDFLTRRRRRLPADPLPKNWEKQATQTTTNIALNERATVASSSPKMTSTAFVFVSSKRSELHCCEKSFIIRIRTYILTHNFVRLIQSGVGSRMLALSRIKNGAFV